MSYPKRICQIRTPKNRVDEVCLALHELGYRWGAGTSLKDTHYSHSIGDTLYSLYVDKTVRYGSIHEASLPLYEVDGFLQEFSHDEDADDKGLNIESLLENNTHRKR